MKALKIILIAAVSILLIAIIVGYLQPRKIDLKISEVIEAPACVVFDNVNDLSKRTQWSPWEQMDTTIVTKLGEVTSGLGASYSWTSEGSGDGSLKYIEVEENKFIKSELDFGQESPAYATFTFNEVEDGVEVIWTFESDMGGAFYNRLFGVMMKAILEQTYNQGLINLEKQALSDNNNPCTSTDAAPTTITTNATILKNAEGIGIKGEIAELEIEGFNYISVVDSCEPTGPQIAQLIGGSYGKIMGTLQQNKVMHSSAPIVFYHKWEPPTKVVMEPAIIVPASEMALAEGIHQNAVSATKVVMGTHMGNYDEVEYLWNALEKYITDNNLEVNGNPWTEYVTDPGLESDTTKWESRVYFPVK